VPGPPPDRNARRTNYRPDWRTLPAEGRQGDPPAFPLGKPTKAVESAWVDLWSTPQAVAWEELGWIRLVARYAKLLIESEKRDAKVTLLGEVRQLEDRLGLSPMAMKRLQWEIGDANADTDADTAEGDRPDNVTEIEQYRQLYERGGA
jgi:hypothetical protein